MCIVLAEKLQHYHATLILLFALLIERTVEFINNMITNHFILFIFQEWCKLNTEQHGAADRSIEKNTVNF